VLEESLHLTDSFIDFLLEICFVSLCFIFTDRLIRLGGIDFFLVVLTDIADSDLSLLGEATRDLDEIATTLLSEWWYMDEDRLTIIGRIESKSSISDTLLYVSEGRLVPWLDDDSLSIESRDCSDIAKWLSRSVREHSDSLDDRRVGAPCLELRELHLEVIRGFL
jgi:hypothetical protein